jgi:hypothetical protein
MVVVCVAVLPTALLLSLMYAQELVPASITEHPVLLGVLPWAVVIAAAASCALFLGWLGGKAASRWGSSHAT